MARPKLAQRSYSLGMMRDFPRDRLPDGAVWNLVDYIPDNKAGLRKRAGNAYNSPALGASTYVDTVFSPVYPNGNWHLQAIGSDGKLYKIDSASAATDKGAAHAVAQNPFLHRDYVIVPAASGSATPKKIDSTPTLTTLTGAPTGKFGCVHMDMTVLANSSTEEETVWFSDFSDPTSWDTTNAWIPTSSPVVGVASSKPALMVFHKTSTERILGTTPPPGTDMQLRPLFDVGCMDARSIVNWGDYVIWAEAGGVYMSDGTSLLDLTRVGGMKSYWQETFSTYSSSFTVAGGLIRDNYIVSIMNGTTPVDTLMCDLPRRRWWRLSNFPARSFGRATSIAGSGVVEYVSMALANAGRTVEISPGGFFAPVASTKNDYNGTAVTPVVELPFWDDPPHAQTGYRALFMRADLRDSASDNPILTVSYVTAPEATSYTALPTTFAETSASTRRRIPMGFSSHGVGLKIAQSNASADTAIYDIELDAHSREGSR